MIGKIKHSIFENFSNEERKIISQIDNNFDPIDMAIIYEEFLNSIAEKVFVENREAIDRFMIDKEEILKKVQRDFSEDIKLRIASIKEAIKNGFSKETLWDNLESIYLSEIRLESEAIGLKGRVDRVKIERKNHLIVPYELKSREDNIFHSDELQLTAYAMLLEPYYRTVINKGVIEVGNKKQEIEITRANREEVLKIAEQIRNIEAIEPPPIQSNFKKCQYCDFREECMKLK
jgi:CRISPR-associated exonuclease Cas4